MILITRFDLDFSVTSRPHCSCVSNLLALNSHVLYLITYLASRSVQARSAQTRWFCSNRRRAGTAYLCALIQPPR
jgi:hypothetical protein